MTKSNTEKCQFQLYNNIEWLRASEWLSFSHRTLSLNVCRTGERFFSLSCGVLCRSRIPSRQSLVSLCISNHTERNAPRVSRSLEIHLCCGFFSHCNEICVDEKISKVQSKDAKIAPKKRDIYKLNSEQRATNCEEWERDERRKKNVRNTANWRILSTFVKWEVQRYRYVQYVGRVLKELFANSYLSLTECCELNYSILLYKLCRFFLWLS